MLENKELKKEIYSKLKNGEFDSVEELSLKLMDDDIHNSDCDSLLKIAKFWKNRSELFSYSDENGEKLFHEWDIFLDFCSTNKIDNKKAVISIKEFVFTNIVDTLIETYRTASLPSVETLIMLGQSFYEIGIIEKAIETLEYALSISGENEDVRIYVLLGNVYTDTGNNQMAMIMFNEAFLKFPQFIDISFVNFQPIQKVHEMVLTDGFKENEILEWIPVYGYIYNALTVKRKIDSIEYEDLKRKLLDYERSLKVDKKVVNIIIPRLINFYLWLFDYYFYQLSALGSCKNIIKRIDDLISEFPVRKDQDAGIKQKLREKTQSVLKGILNNKSVR